MKKGLLFLIFTVFAAAGFSPTAAEAVNLTQTIRSIVSPAVQIAPINPGSTLGSIDPQTGNVSAISSSFSLKTNGISGAYDFVLTSLVRTTGGVQVNAYAKNGTNYYIILGNNASVIYPTAAAVTNIKSGTPVAASNANAIAYQVLSSVTGFDSIQPQNDSAYGGIYFQVEKGSAQQGTVVQALQAAPLVNTYSSSDDRPGTYEAVVTLSAYRKL